jgi:uncharacterized protein (TIGR03000 family)
MYTIVLAAVLSTGPTAPAADIYEDIRDIKREVEELRQGQSQIQAEGLKLVIAGLRQKLTDEKLDELRRDIRTLQNEELTPHALRGLLPLWLHHHLHGAVHPHMPGAARLEPVGHRSVVSLQVPAGATFTANGEQIPLDSANPTFITPPLEPGRDYFYDLKVDVTQDGKTVTKTKRVPVRAGGLVRVNYDDMEAR